MREISTANLSNDGRSRSVYFTFMIEVYQNTYSMTDFNSEIDREPNRAQGPLTRSLL